MRLDGVRVPLPPSTAPPETSTTTWDQGPIGMAVRGDYDKTAMN